MRMPPLLLVLSIAGCQWVARFVSEPAEAGRTAERDIGSDGAADARNDAADAASDAWSDAADAAADASAEQTSSDMLGLEGPIQASCAGNAVVVASGKFIAFCAVDGGGVTQCHAEALCGAGWRLCKPLQYRHWDDINGPPSAADKVAWIGGCVRQSGGPALEPTTSHCDPCFGPGDADAAAVAWPCDGGPHLETFLPTIGLVTNPVCHRVGTDEPQWAAHWHILSTVAKLNSAACCYTPLQQTDGGVGDK